jgi:transposase
MKKPDFSRLTLYVGIDVHKRQWNVSIYSEHAYHATFSQPPCPGSLKSYLDKHFPQAKVVSAYECSKFGYWICRELLSYGYECLVVNAADIPTSNKEMLEKTDPVDSRKIAKALRAGLLHSIYIPTLEGEGDRQLFRYRKKLWGDLVRVKNRIKDKFLFSGIKIPEKYDNPFWGRAFIVWLKEVEMPTESVRQSLDLLIEQYEFLFRHFQKTSTAVRKLQRKERYKPEAKMLRAIPGIGPLTTVQFLTEIEDIDRFSSFRKMNSFIGFKPTSHSSGDRDLKGKITYRRHKALRSSLIECAWSAMRKDPALMLRYQELLVNHTPKRAIIIIARKLLARIYHVLKYKAPYCIGVMQ